MLFLDLKPHQKKRGFVEIYKMTKALKILSTSQNDMMRESGDEMVANLGPDQKVTPPPATHTHTVRINILE